MHMKLLPACLALLTPVMSSAQTTSSSAPSSSAPDAAVELTPFEVRADRDVGYLGLDAASGSRLNSRVKDTPASISVFTAEFLQDIGATSVEDISRYAMN